MAKELKKMPTPEELATQRERMEKQGVGFTDILRALSLGLLPNAPRLPQQAYTGATTMGGGYQKGYAGYGGMKGTMSFATLRQVAERSPMLSAIISRKLFQSVRYSRPVQRSKKGDIGFKIVHKRDSEENFSVPKEFDVMCRELEKSFMKPWLMYWNDGIVNKDVEPNLSGFVSKIMEDLLVINRPVVELGLDPHRIPRAFGAIDGANIVPTFAALKFLTRTADNFPYRSWQDNSSQLDATMQWFSDRYGVDITDRTEYLYMLSGRPVAGFRHDEILIAPMMPTTDVRHAGYPRSLTERAIWIVLAEILAMQTNLQFFEKGNMAEILLAMKGNYDDEHVKQLAEILQANMSGVQGMFRVPLVALPGGSEDLNVLNLKQNHRDMLFDFYIQKLTNLACAVFSMHPSEINEAPRAADNSGSLNQASQTVQIGLAQEQGLQGHLLHLKSTIFDPILERIDDNLTWEWDYGENEAQTIQIATSKATFMTVNERRVACGMKPISKESGGEVIDNPFIQAQQQSQQAAQQQGQEGQPPAGEGQPGNQSEQEGESSESESATAGKQGEIQGPSVRL